MKMHLLLMTAIAALSVANLAAAEWQLAWSDEVNQAGESAEATPAGAAIGRRQALFDGKSLEGWSLITCEAKADGGDILIQSGNGILQTARQYANFVLEFDWKPLRADKWDSGVYFRYLEIPANRPWPDRYQVNLLQGQEGNLVGFKEGVSKGLIQARDWNRFKLTVRGSTCALEINGQAAWQVDGLKGPAAGYIGLQAEVPGGGEHRFRNIYVTPLR